MFGMADLASCHWLQFTVLFFVNLLMFVFSCIVQGGW